MRLRRTAARPAQQRVEHDRIGDRRRQRADAVERRRERLHAVALDPRGGRLEPDDAAERRGHADRAGRVGADRARHDAGGHRDRRPRRGAARDPPRCARIARRAEVRVQAQARVRELAQVRLADAHHPGGRQPGDHRRVRAGRRRIASQRRARRGAYARHVDEVLPRDRHAVERPARGAGAQPRGALRRLAQRALLGQRDERAAGRGRSRERVLGERDRLELAGREPPAELQRGAGQAAAATG